MASTETSKTVTTIQTQKEKVKLRQRIKSKKPKFLRQESWRYKRVKPNWRRPRGIDSKMRQGIKGWPKSVKIGYSGPRKARFLHPSGYEEVRVYNLDQIESVDPEKQAIRIAHNVGAKKRMEILLKAREKGIRVLNPREVKKTEEEEFAVEEEKEEITDAKTESDEKENSKNKSR